LNQRVNQLNLNGLLKGKFEIKKDRGIYCTIDSVKDVANGIIEIMLKSKEIYIEKMNVPLGS